MKSTSSKPRRLSRRSKVLSALSVAVFSAVGTAGAADGTWTSAAGGTYSDPGTYLKWGDSSNWVGGVVGGGAGSSVSFTSFSSGTRILGLDQDITVGSLSFSGNGTFDLFNVSTSATDASGNPTGPLYTINLATADGSSPIINVVGGTLNTAIYKLTGNNGYSFTQFSGNQGFTKTGSGNLNITGGGQAFYGDIVLNGGTITLAAGGSGSVINTANNVLVLGAGTTLKVGSSGGANAIVAGINSTGTNGKITDIQSNIRGVAIVGGGQYSYGGRIVSSASGNNPSVLVYANLINGGSQTFTNANNVYQGTNTVASGSLISAADMDSAGTTPFGTGSIVLSSTGSNYCTAGAGALVIAPTGNNSAKDVSYTGASVLVSGSIQAKMTYWNGSQLVLNKGNANSLTYTVGLSTAAENTTLVNAATSVTNNRYNARQGTLIIGAGSGTDKLGTSTGERFIVNGGVAMTNDIVNPAIIGRDDSSTGGGAGTFLSYDNSNGFVTGTYSTSTDINAGSATAFADTRVFDATAATTNTLTAAANVYALRTSGQTISGDYALSVGDNTGGHAAGVILNGGAINTKTLSFGNAYGVIYTSGNAAISANILNTGSSYGGASVTFLGSGTVSLTGSNNFYGGMFVNDTTVAVNSNYALGAYSAGGTDVGNVTLRGGAIRVASDLTIQYRNIILNPGVSDGGGIFDVADGATLTITGTSVNGKWISGVGSLTKAGAGSLILNGSGDNTYTGATFVKAGKLQMGSARQLLGSKSAVVMSDDATAILDLNGYSQVIGSLDGGGANGGNVMLGSATLTTGTDHSSTTYAGVISGDGGSLVKVGLGTFTLSNNNTYTGSTSVTSGELDVDGSLASSAVSVSSGAVLGGKGSISGDVNVSDGGTVKGSNLNVGGVTTFDGSSTLSGRMSSVGGIAVASTGRLNVTGTTSSRVTVNGVLNGTGSTGAVVLSSGTLNGTLSTGAISGTGLVSPGNSPGILTATSVTVGNGLNFAFELTQAIPDYTNALDSKNDVLHLTADIPFSDGLGAAAQLGTGNTISVYLATGAMGDKFAGGFFADKISTEVLLDAVKSASFAYYVLDTDGETAGDVLFNSNYYTSLESSKVVVSAVDVTGAAFATGATNGSVLEFTVVPEPSTWALMVGSLGLLVATQRRKFRLV